MGKNTRILSRPILIAVFASTAATVMAAISLAAPEALQVVVRPTVGWEVPGLAFVGPPGPPETATIDGCAVTKSRLTLLRKPVIEMERFTIDGRSLIVQTDRLLVHEISAWAYNGRTFAYQLKVEMLLDSRGDGAASRLSGGVSTLSFIDSGGAGTFETRRYGPAVLSGYVRELCQP